MKYNINVYGIIETAGITKITHSHGEAITLVEGLTSQQVREQVEKGNVNVRASSDTLTVKEIVKKNVLTYFNLIYLVLAILCIIVGSFKSLTFLPAVIVNSLIGTLQEISAKRTMDKLTLLHQSQFTVIRDGQQQTVPSDELVLGDIIMLKSGAQVPADAKVIDGHVRVNEALLTGEEDEIEKVADTHLLSGSFIVGGECYAVLERVGEESYASKLVKTANRIGNDNQSEMVKDINLIIKIAGIILIPIGIGLFIRSFAFSGNTFHDSILSVVAAVVGMVPQGLYLLFTAALALSTVKLARKQVLLHDMRSVETLARVDVFCVDKTGTITEDKMTVREIIFPDHEREADDISKLIGAYLNIMPDSGATTVALKEKFTEAGDLTAKEIMPFSSKTKYSAIRTENMDYYMGAPDILLTEEMLKHYEGILKPYEELGLRVLVFCQADGRMMEVLSIMALENPIRQDVAETFKYFKEQGVRIIVISGDNPLTVSKLAARANIDGAENYINASQIESDEDLLKAINTKTVFGRSTPEQKRRIVRMLRKQGHKVAMTGDGVNDILAMKEADCSIAMGTGSDAAKQAAQVVLMDSAFSKMKNIVNEGRQDINNIQRSATLFLTKNMFSLMLGLFSIFMLSSYPLVPSQIALINGFNIGLPATLLALEKNTKRQQGNFLLNVMLRCMPAAITAFAVIAAMAKFGEIFDISTEDVSVAATYLLGVVTLMILLQITKPLNLFRGAVLVVCLGGLIFTGIWMHDLFSLSAISFKSFILMVAFAIVAEPLLRYLTMFAQWIGRKTGTFVEEEVEAKEETIEAI